MLNPEQKGDVDMSELDLARYKAHQQLYKQTKELATPTPRSKRKQPTTASKEGKTSMSRKSTASKGTPTEQTNQDKLADCSKAIRRRATPADTYWGLQVRRSNRRVDLQKVALKSAQDEVASLMLQVEDLNKSVANFSEKPKAPRQPSAMGIVQIEHKAKDRLNNHFFEAFQLMSEEVTSSDTEDKGDDDDADDDEEEDEKAEPTEQGEATKEEATDASAKPSNEGEVVEEKPTDDATEKESTLEEPANDDKPVESKRTDDLIPTDQDLDKTLRQLKKQGKAKQKKTHSQKSSTTQSDTHKVMTDNRSLNSFRVPSQDGIPTGLKMPAITTENFEIKPALLSMVQQNHPTDEPINHMQRFQQLCSTVHHKGVTQDQLRVMLFGFYLRDRAQKWLNTVKETEWSKISQAFLKEYFPPSKTEKIQHQISTFS
ncbi:nucleolin-like [Chenopodium quinoa]|uniref:nucleolin-like n=1 Tax=Chenopodium quinoa TaxID=63459 RepID=UPI000B786469|nr:nucleolin-like [Chenopodium quinoa]